MSWPKSRATLAGKDIIITQAKVHIHHLEPGEVIVENKHILVGCGKDALVIERLTPAGKKEMTAAAFLAGYGHLLS